MSGLREADAELEEALARYTRIRAELGERFAEAVLATVERIARNPTHYAVLENGRRRAGVYKFPYGLFFVLEDTRVLVVACFHGRRNPNTGNRDEAARRQHSDLASG